MILTRDELRRMAARRRLNLGSLEKEYVLDLVLRSLSGHEELRQVLVLKGGTALNRFYLGARLSLDLDFTTTRPMTLAEVRPALEIAEIGATIAEYQAFHDALTVSRLRYVGPLEHANSVRWTSVSVSRCYCRRRI
jgi:predicted nucleotidyltransferase component of viral defense system